MSSRNSREATGDVQNNRNTERDLLDEYTNTESYTDNDLDSEILPNISEPRHDKTCLRKFPTRPDTNRLAQPQKLARVLKFRP